MIPIFALSIVAVYIFIERYMTIRKASSIEGNFISQIKDHMVSGNIDAAKQLCQRTDSPIARMIEKGLMRLGKPLKNIDVAIENVGKLEIFKLEV